MSFLRSMSVRKPSSSKRPTSPVRMKRSPVGARTTRPRRSCPAGCGSRSSSRRSGRPPRRSRPAATSWPSSSIRRMSWPGTGWPTVCSLSGMLVRQQHAGAAALGHAVELDQAARPALQHVGLQRRGERRAGAELHAEGRRGRSGRSRAASISRWYCTGTSMAWVTRCFSASSQELRRRRTSASAPPCRPAPWSAGRRPGWCSNRAASRSASPRRGRR